MARAAGVSALAHGKEQRYQTRRVYHECKPFSATCPAEGATQRPLPPNAAAPNARALPAPPAARYCQLAGSLSGRRFAAVNTRNSNPNLPLPAALDAPASLTVASGSAKFRC